MKNSSRNSGLFDVCGSTCVLTVKGSADDASVCLVRSLSKLVMLEA